jgi:predicted AlkP superfamily pyrophosphatase or phosphodiesterase
MRADYVERVFARLRDEGAVFTSARHTHVPTETAPGHAAISSGRLPRTHGIVANDWYDRVLGRDTYCMEDALYGLSPERMQGPTLADGLKAVSPESRVFAVSSKDRSAITMGGRKADVALWFDRMKGEFVTSAYYRRPAWLGAFNEKLKKSGRLALKDGRVPSAALAAPALDQVTRELVSELLAREKPGRGKAPDLLMVSFSGTDTVGHTHGISGEPMRAQLESLDKEFSILLAQLEKASGGELVLALSSDHGAVPEPEGEAGKALGIQRYDWRGYGQALEAALQKKWPSEKRRILSNQIPHLYFDPAFAASAGLGELAKTLAAQEGVHRVYDPAALLAGKHDADPLAQRLKWSIRPDRSGDLLVILKEEVLLHDKVPGTSHGSPWDYDARVPLVFWGKGVRPGRHDVPAAVVDLAPTMARLIGFDYPAGDGGAVRLEALAEPPAAAPAEAR